MRVLGIESSCDETAAAVVEDGARLRSSVVASQVEEHARFGGVVPEIASRRHLESIGPVVRQALDQAGVGLGEIDAVAVTRGPGLIGSLLVGVCYAKALALARGVPLVGVNHIEAHIAALGLEHTDIEYPAVALVVSGGHTALYLQREPRRCQLIGRTRDDAVGEAFDKVARLVGLPYPGGPAIDKLARGHQVKEPVFPRVRMSDGSLDFSFSGLKSAVARFVRDNGISVEAEGTAEGRVRDVVTAFQDAAVDTLLDRLDRAARDRWPRSLLVAGGVACNSVLRARVQELGRELGVKVHVPRPGLATDNAAMVAALGYHHLVAGERDGETLDADPSCRVASGESQASWISS